MIKLLHSLSRTVVQSGRSASLPGKSALPVIATVCLFIVLAFTGCSRDPGPMQQVALGGERPLKKRNPAPGLFGGTAWLNSSKPLALDDLKGRIVVLDFWTLCCINCIHTLPDLAKLEAKYGGMLVVIGVHTPKFENEKNTESIRKAVLRYQIKHPVVNDADQKIWQRFRANSWPTLVVIDAEGNLVAKGSGEGLHDALDKLIGELVKEAKDKKILKEDPIDFGLEKEHTGALNFPGKVLADAASNRLFIADSTNHRIVITDLEGKKIAVAGDGVEGLKDGKFAEARFSDPQGMALLNDVLYVADRKNHALRALNLKDQTVSIIAGTGEQNREERDRGGTALKIGLNSPWDLLWHNGKLFIAMAGHHQIWTYDPDKLTVDPYAGSGREDIIDGPLANAAFAQPSGLTTDGTNLYVADSEVSGIRSVPLNGKGRVSTVVGEGLFVFGDEDGQGDKVRLQHALGVIFRDGQLYVADTYNNKIKLIDPEKRTCKTFLGDPLGWLKPKMFNEPGGLSFAGDRMYVADTNNHRIRVVDMKTRAVSTLELQGVEAPVREKKK
ncbi:MAG: redoxin domain-containing protein [Gemmataceae bacterium]|nr:redoxin domain-containing protein [Gemmataceae bacterium]MCI0741641.1 redoxin domain-containing protein [Gemmataceae bacterium]